jgi:hypothetical protein
MQGCTEIAKERIVFFEDHKTLIPQNKVRPSCLAGVLVSW